METQAATSYFFGVRPGDANGHFCHVPGLAWAERDAPLTPWASGYHPIGERAAMKAAFDPGGRDRDWAYGTSTRIKQTEGMPGFARKDGWTLVALWDRSADRRGGCCAMFAFHKELTDPEALACAKRVFPRVFARIEKHLGRAVEVGS